MAQPRDSATQQSSEQMASPQLPILEQNDWRSFIHKNLIILIASFFINILGLVFPLFLLQIYDRIIPNQALQSLTVLVLIVIGAVIVEVVLKILRSIAVSWANVRTEYLEQKKLITKLLNADLKTYELKGAGDYLERLRSISSLRENLSGQNIINFIDMPFALVFIFLVWYLGGLLVIVPLFLLAILFAMYYVLTKRTDKASEEQKENMDRRSNFLIELLGGMHTVKALALEKLLLRRYERLQTQATELNYNLKRYTTISLTMIQFISQLNTVAIVSIGSFLVIQGHMTVGGLAACTLLSARMLQPVNQILGYKQRHTLQKKEKDRIKAMKNIAQMEYDKQTNKTIINKASIEFKQVTFSYKKTDILQNINLSVPEKTTIAITGTSVSGKSTLLQLITGVLHPDSGQVLIGGLDVHAYNPEYLNKAIGYLTKDGYLFAGTILENLTMFNDANRLRAFELTKELGLEPLIVKLPNGYHTQVGSTAVELLAPGIKQLITIVRSLISNELKIILFDEANMALDIPSDINLIKFLAKLGNHCTMVLVSYRPSVLKLASKQYFLDGGSLHEQENSQ